MGAQVTSRYPVELHDAKCQVRVLTGEGNYPPACTCAIRPERLREVLSAITLALGELADKVVQEREYVLAYLEKDRKAFEGQTRNSPVVSREKVCRWLDDSIEDIKTGKHVPVPAPKEETPC